ncbi:MAG: phosphoribosylformylglycinamidine cyclo-ligase [Clostridiales bacterium]|nr:phosphoribosylformylglycinamidine cyclo-ligase [Clostridiales bacterium]
MNSVYKKAGVDIEAGYKSINLIKKYIEKTNNLGVLSHIGGFNAMFEISKSYKNPVLISSADGIGTKLKIAFIMDKHDTVGIDCVAMCVNDIICSGAKPIFFLDYIAIGKNEPEKIAEIVKGISNGCLESYCSLVGGETAEMPGFYKENEYDIAGFSVGVIEKDNIIDGSKLKSGDVLIGISSSGIHSNGFSLIRKIFNINDNTTKEKISLYSDELSMPISEELLKPTKIYIKSMLEVIKCVEVKGISHITGGGFVENIPRMLTNDLRAVVDKKTFLITPIFRMIENIGKITEEEMFNVFNMGIGMVFAVSKIDADKAIEVLQNMGEKAYLIGEIKNGEKGIDIF